MFPLQQLLRIKYFERYFARTVKNRSRRILRLWTDHCEYIIAQRFRRGQQMLCLYRRIWDEQALRQIVQLLRIQVINFYPFIHLTIRLSAISFIFYRSFFGGFT